MENNYYKNIAGWFDFPKFYDYVVKKFISGTFVEIGVWQGQSLMYLAEKIKESGKNIKLLGIDTFEGTGSAMLHEAGFNTPDELYNKYLQNIEPLKHLITTIRGNSHEVCNQFFPHSIEFLFIDGDHAYEPFKKDLELWYPKVKPGGIISGHDYTELYGYGVVQVVNEFFGKQKIKRSGKFVWYYYKK